MTEEIKNEILEYIFNAYQNLSIEDILCVTFHDYDNDSPYCDYVCVYHISDYDKNGIEDNYYKTPKEYNFKNNTIIYENEKYKCTNNYTNGDGKYFLTSRIVYKEEFISTIFEIKAISEYGYKLDNRNINFDVIDNL